MSTETLMGGCLCGAVRYRTGLPILPATICHLQVVSPRGRGQCRRPLHRGEHLGRVHARPPGGVPVIPQGASRVLWKLRYGTHVLGSRLASGVIADHREPRRPWTRSAGRSYVDGACRRVGQSRGSSTVAPDGPAVMGKAVPSMARCEKARVRSTKGERL
jgi:hypothetical protein